MVSEIEISESKVFNGEVFPLTFVPKYLELNNLETLTNWVSSNTDQIDELLLKHKAILFRNFNVKDANDFHEVIIATKFQSMDYIGGAAVRTALTSRVFTANESPASENIPFHHELAQTPSPPTHLLFYCDIPPEKGGETPILISNEVYEYMKVKHPQFIDKLELLGVKYIRILSEEDDPSSAIGRGWKSTFLTDSKGIQINHSLSLSLLIHLFYDGRWRRRSID